MKKILCFGLEPYKVEGYETIHVPLIEVIPLPLPDLKEPLERSTHLILTSKTAVTLFPLCKRPVLAVGKATASKALEKGFEVEAIASNESQEGMIDLIAKVENPSFLWPRSELARPLLEGFCIEKHIPLFTFPLYTLLFRKVDLPSLLDVEALYFSSSSTVDAFFALEIDLPPHLQFFTQGEVTKKYLTFKLSL